MKSNILSILTLLFLSNTIFFSNSIAEDSGVKVNYWTQLISNGNQCQLIISILNNSGNNIYLPLEGEDVSLDTLDFYYDNSLLIGDNSISKKNYASNSNSFLFYIEYSIEMMKLVDGDSINFIFPIKNVRDELEIHLNINYNTNEIEPYLKQKENSVFETTNVKFWIIGFKNITIDKKLLKICKK